MKITVSNEKYFSTTKDKGTNNKATNNEVAITQTAIR